jgi:AcrR family transcriptional regulator
MSNVRTPEAKKARQEGILQTAIRVFLEAGALQTLETIAHRYGIGKGTIYLYWDNKESISEAALAEMVKGPVDAATISSDLLAQRIAFFAGFIAEHHKIGCDRLLTLTKNELLALEKAMSMVADRTMSLRMIERAEARITGT